MSTKYQEEYEPKNRIKCKICDAMFVPGGTKKPLPPRVCAWCFFRGRIVARMELLWEALEIMHAEHVGKSLCECRGCKIHEAAKSVMIDQSEEKP